MGAFIYSTRKRMGYKSRLKDRVENIKNSMMQYAIMHDSFVDEPLLGVLNIKSLIAFMPIGFGDKLPMKLKDIFFKLPFELHHIGLVMLIFTKLVPGQEKITDRRYLIIGVTV